MIKPADADEALRDISEALMQLSATMRKHGFTLTAIHVEEPIAAVRYLSRSSVNNYALVTETDCMDIRIAGVGIRSKHDTRRHVAHYLNEAAKGVTNIIA